MTDWSSVLRAVSPRAKRPIVDGLCASLDDVLDRYRINTPLRQAHFIAQVGHESAGFTTLKEIGGAAYFARYNNRKDLGNGPNDGPKFYGRGLIQLTGRANYRSMAKKIGLPLEQQPDLVLNPETSLIVACEFWTSRGLNKFADADDIRSITKRINGGYNGLSDRIEKLSKAKRALGASGRFALGIMGDPDEVEGETIDTDASDEPALTRDEVFQVQCRLRTLHYYDVGDADGEMGSFTRTAIYSFKLDNGIEPADSEITPEFLQKLVIAGPRPISDKRAHATSQELADKGVSEVKASMSARLWSGVQAGAASVAAAAASAKAFVGDYVDQFSPYKAVAVRAFHSIPPSLVAVLFIGIAGVSILIWYKANRATVKATEAYQVGARK